MKLLEEKELEERLVAEEKEGKGWENGEIEESEIRKAIRRMKLKKAVGIDEISMETWKYASKELEKEMIKLIKKVW